MCISFNFFKELFKKKPENEHEIVENTVINEETASTQETIGILEPAAAQTTGETSALVVLLDNGHAKSTPGKRSPLMDDGRRFFEYEFNRDVVSRISVELDGLGIKHHVLVPEVEQDITLSERARRANEYCDKYGAQNCIFISVHSNAYGKGDKWEDPGKWSVWTTVGVTKSDAYAKTMYEVAEEMLRPYGFECRDGKVQGNGNAGPDYEENFTVLYKTKCPAILTENLFFTNKKECEWLMTNTGRQVIADIHIEGIRRIIENI